MRPRSGGDTTDNPSELPMASPDLLERFSIAWMPNLAQRRGTRRTPLCPPLRRGEKDQTPPTFPPLRRGDRGVRAPAHAMHLKTALTPRATEIRSWLCALRLQGDTFFRKDASVRHVAASERRSSSRSSSTVFNSASNARAAIPKRASRNLSMASRVRDQPRNPPKYTEKKIRITFPFPCPIVLHVRSLCAVRRL